MTDVDQKLETLYDLLVDNFATLETELKDLISNPEKIKNTNKFASLLSDLKNSNFINPLLLTISLSDKGAPWLTDFLYAAINLLDESSVNDEFEIPKNLIDKLQVWVLDNKGEIAWKSASLLKFYESEKAEKIQLKKLEERGDFFLTYAECILGLLRFDNDKHIGLVEQLSKDETVDEKLREFCSETIQNYR
jgi:hypothetical protein